MASFTVRVELIDAVYEDYEILYEEMQNRNFTKTIFSDEGVEYYLPPAEYNRVGEYSLEQTYNAAVFLQIRKLIIQKTKISLLIH